MLGLLSLPWAMRRGATAAGLICAIALAGCGTQALAPAAPRQSASPAEPSGSSSSSLGTKGGSGQAPTSALPLYDLHMLDAHTGWALTAGAGVVRTTDGGVHWQAVLAVAPPPLFHPESCAADFASGQDAWLACPLPEPNPGVDWDISLWQTTDAGVRWAQHTVKSTYTPADTIGSMSAASLDFVDAMHGWLMVEPSSTMNSRPGELFATTDGGSTWSIVSRSEPGALPFAGAVRFISATTGWLAGGKTSTTGNLLYESTNGGATWRDVAFPIPPGKSALSAVVSPPTFFSPTEGVMPVWFQGRAQTYLYWTHDAGRTWVRTTPESGSRFSVVSASDIYVIDGADVFHTTDGGATWQATAAGGALPEALAQQAVLQRADFVSGGAGWLLATTEGEVTDKSLRATTPPTWFLLRTIDGGRFWSSVTPTLGGG